MEFRDTLSNYFLNMKFRDSTYKWSFAIVCIANVKFCEIYSHNYMMHKTMGATLETTFFVRDWRLTTPVEEVN